MENNTQDKKDNGQQAIERKNLYVLVVDQDQTLYEGEADSVIAPGKADMEIGILPFHTPFYTQLFKGDLRIYNKKVEKKFHIEGGIARVINNTVVVLVGF